VDRRYLPSSELYDIYWLEEGITIAPHLFPELNAQLLASISNGVWIEDMGLSNDLFVDPVPVIDAIITAPERPSQGFAFRSEILHDCRTWPFTLLLWTDIVHRQEARHDLRRSARCGTPRPRRT
jgi:hypothetical protein